MLRRAGILLACERVTDGNMDQTAFRFGFPDVSQNASEGRWLSQTPAMAAVCCARDGTVAKANSKGLLSENTSNLISEI